MKLVVFSICKDEAQTIGELLDRIPKKIKGIKKIETLVVSDGSVDDTVKVARRHGAETIEGVSQKRLAFRFQEAVAKALDMGADIAVNIDGDLQFSPEDIPQLTDPILKGRADFVAADRFTDPKTGLRRKPEGMPGNKYYANRLGAFIVGWLSGKRFRDVTCGFRAYSRDALMAINLNSEYTYTQESFQLLASKKFDIETTPVEVKYYEGRKSRVVTSFTKFLFGSALNILRAFRDFSPLRFFTLIGFLFFGIGVATLIFLGIYWLQTGAFTPYKSVGFAGIYFISIAIILWVVGLLADMLKRVVRNQEKILEETRRVRYELLDSEKGR